MLLPFLALFVFHFKFLCCDPVSSGEILVTPPFLSSGTFFLPCSRFGTRSYEFLPLGIHLHPYFLSPFRISSFYPCWISGSGSFPRSKGYGVRIHQPNYDPSSQNTFFLRIYWTCRSFFRSVPPFVDSSKLGIFNPLVFDPLKSNPPRTMYLLDFSLGLIVPLLPPIPPPSKKASSFFFWHLLSV